MKHKVTYFASIPPTDGALKAHGDGGFRITYDVPESETPAYIRLLLARGHVLRMTTEWSDTDALPARKKKKAEPEWGDDGDTDGDT